jgi:predicted enzyme related to lactoylglutathione lyase
LGGAIMTADPIRLAQITVAARDLDASKAFYKEVLGLTHLFDAPNVSALDIDGVRLLLTMRPDYAAPENPAVLFYLSTHSIEARQADWIGRGAEEAGAPHCVANLSGLEIWIAFVKDPAGNLIGLIEERAPVR